MKIALKLTVSHSLGFDKPAKLLIQKGANVNIMGQQDHTPLIIAAAQGEKLYGRFVLILIYYKLRTFII